jgi:hypothetical protein
VIGSFGTTTTVLADTGTLGDSGDARHASLLTGTVPSLLTGDTLHATTIGGSTQVSSEASLADLALTVAGTTVGADFVMSRARAVWGAAGADVSISGLSINGLLVAVTGDPNQTIDIVGGRVVINEQQPSPTSIGVSALHVIVDGVADVVVASASAGIQ